jgi:hypothetical protein
LRHFHLGIRFEEPAFFVSGAINLAAAAGIFSERRAEVLRYSPLALISLSPSAERVASSLSRMGSRRAWSMETVSLDPVDGPFMDLK